jgi:uncharacterized protein YciI
VYLVELAFGDDPERLAARPAHRQRLQGLREDGVVRMAGPFSDDSGALLIFDVDEASVLRRLIEADPYFRTPGVTIVRQQEWSPFVT